MRAAAVNRAGQPNARIARALHELLLYALLTVGPVALGIAGFDRLVGATASGTRMLQIGAALTVLGVFAGLTRGHTTFSWRRMIAVFTGMWSMAAFALFIVWRIMTAAEQAHACESGVAEQCYILGARKERRGEFEEAERWLGAGCALGHPRACFELGGLVEAGRTQGEHPSAAALLVQACDGGVGLACERAAHRIRSGQAVPGADPEALIRRGCELGALSACSAMTAQPTAAPVDATR